MPVFAKFVTLKPIRALLGREREANASGRQDQNFAIIQSFLNAIYRYSYPSSHTLVCSITSFLDALLKFNVCHGQVCLFTAPR